MLSIVNTFKVILTFVFFRNKMCKLISIFHALLNFDMYQCEKPCFMNQTMPQKIYSIKQIWGSVIFSHICVHKLWQLFKWVKNSNILYWLLYTYFPFMVSQSMSEYLTSPLILYSSMDDFFFFFFLVSLVWRPLFCWQSCVYIFVLMYILLLMNFLICQFYIHVPCLLLAHPDKGIFLFCLYLNSSCSQVRGFQFCVPTHYETHLVSLSRKTSG